MNDDFLDRQAVIDLGALSANFRLARRLAGAGVRVMGVVKADAYGHGLIPAARRLAAEGAEYLGVARLDEVEELRRAGVGLPVAVLAGLLPREAAQAVRLKALPFVFDLETAEALAAAARNLGRRAQVLIKIDTGMTRLGFDLDGLGEVLRRLKELDGLAVRGLASHLATADEADKTAAEQQIERFKAALGLAGDIGLELDLNSLANSAGLIDLPQARFDLVRPGIMLYGCLPGDGLHNKPELEPVMTLKTRLIQIREVEAGRGVSYGLTYRAPTPIRIGVVPLGYGHGLSRRLSNRGSMLANGRRAPIIGRVCMNLTMLDITGLEGVEVGDVVVALGRQEGAVLRAEEVAEAAGSISYELLCTLGGFNPRRYIG